MLVRRCPRSGRATPRRRREEAAASGAVGGGWAGKESGCGVAGKEQRGSFFLEKEEKVSMGETR